jgi:hypothetical protein
MLYVARRDFKESFALIAFERGEVVAEQRESPDVPVVFGRGNGRLQQNANRSCHALASRKYRNRFDANLLASRPLVKSRKRERSCLKTIQHQENE